MKVQIEKGKDRVSFFNVRTQHAPLLTASDQGNQNTNVSAKAILNDDCLRSIFLMLDPKTLGQIKKVCRRWHNLINDPNFWQLYAVNHFPNRPITLAKEHLALAIRNSYLEDKGELPALTKPLDLDDYYDTELQKSLLKGGKSARSGWCYLACMGLAMGVALITGLYAIYLAFTHLSNTSKIIGGSALAAISLLATAIGLALVIKVCINSERRFYQSNYLFRFYHRQHQNDILFQNAEIKRIYQDIDIRLPSAGDEENMLLNVEEGRIRAYGSTI